jgi:predicted nucleotidyltransferase
MVTPAASKPPGACTEPTLLDFSNRTELDYLADLARALDDAAGDLPYFLAGAAARDLLLEQAHGINPGRNTRDLDLGVMLADWSAFQKARLALIESGQFAPLGDVLHNLRFQGIYELDLIPFGAIEQADRTIAWPSGGDTVLNVFGFREAYANSLLVKLPDRARMHIVSLPALALLKLVAWEERRRQRPGADAHDLAIILRNYLDAGNQQRLYTEAADLLEAPDFDYDYAGAWLLGHDLAMLLPEAAQPRLAELLIRESDTNGPLNLLGDLQIQADRALGLLQNLARGFQETSGI